VHSPASFKNLLFKILNIAPHEVGRILEAWSIRLCFQTGFVIGWTMLTAIIVKEFGITMLPWMYMVNALLIVAGSFIYSQIIYAFENRKLIIVSIITALVLLVLDATVFAENMTIFLAVTLVILSVFVSQLHIMLLAFIEELFTPNENERANPIIETSEPLGGIIGGSILALLAGHIHVTDFTYFWAFFMLIIIPILLFFYRKRHRFMTLIPSADAKETGSSRGNRVSHGIKHLRAIPFVRFLAIVIFCQWMFVNILNYQYTKAVDESLGHGPVAESNHAIDTSHTSIDTHAEDDHVEKTTAVKEQKADGHGESNAHEDLLTHGLGTLHIVFSSLMFLMQILLSSRLVARLGIVRAMRIMPGISLAGVLTMLLNFQFFTVIAAKGLYEMFLVVHTNAYHNSYYAISERIREQIREFLEGVMRPLGIFFGTGVLLLIQWLIPGEYLNTSLSLLMGAVLVTMLVLLSWMQGKYTLLAKKNLDLIGDHPEKHLAIEILSQRGHQDASEILTKNLIYKNESPRTKIKILKSLALLRDTTALPEIIAALDDPDEAVQQQACQTLAAYKKLGKHFFSQTFAKYRVVGALTDLFLRTQSKQLRSEIVQVFANIHHDDVVPFLLSRLEDGDDSIKADIINIIGMFHDINAGYYIEKYLDHADSMIRAQTIIALWQFKKYRLKLMIHLTALLDDEEDTEQLLAGIFVLGETKSIQEIPRLLHYLKSDNSDIRTAAAVALAKLGKTEAVEQLLEAMLEGQESHGAAVKQKVRHVESYYVKMLNAHLERHILAKMEEEFGNKKELILDDLPMDKLRNLKYYYELLEHDHAILKIEHMIKRKELAAEKKDA